MSNHPVRRWSPQPRAPRTWSRPAAAPATAPPVAAPAAPAVAAEPAAPAAPATKIPNWPFYIVMAYLFVDFARPHNWFPPLAAIRPGLLVLSGGFLAMVIRFRDVQLHRRAKLMLLFLFLMALGTPLATNRFYAFNATKDMAILLFGAVLPLATFVNTYERARKLTAFFVLIHIPLSFYCITHNGFGIGSFLSDENDFAVAMNVVLPYAFFSLFFVKSRVGQLYLLATVGLFIFTVTATMSRGGFLGLVAVGGMCWLASPRKLASLGALAIVGMIALAMVPDKYWKEMNTIKTADQEGDTGQQRLYLWSMGWKMFLDYPILGVGPTNYQYNSFKYESSYERGKGLHVWGKGSHSLYFTLLPEMGLVGSTVFFSILGLGIAEGRRVRRAYRQYDGSGQVEPELLRKLHTLSVLTRANDAAMVGFLITGTFLTVLYYPFFWLQTAFGIIFCRAFWLTAAALPAAGTLPDAVRPRPVVGARLAPPARA